jgi:hypothetical protein
MKQEPAMQAIPVPTVPWWRVGVMWLFVGGLGLVVAGSFALLGTAIRSGDSVVSQTLPAKAIPNTPTSPALAARNHAATPSP